MPKKFDDMVDAIKQSLKKANPRMSDKEATSRAYAIATDRWKKMHGGKSPSRETTRDWRILEFYVPIEERMMNENDEFIIRGTAINETTTLNNVKYVAEELEKAAPTFNNKKILLDHRNEVLNIVGIVTGSSFNSVKHSIDFEAKIMDKKIQEMISDGRISNVSIGAKVEDLISEEDGTQKAVGIKGLEISLVAVPGDSQATLAQAIQQGFHLKELAMAEKFDELNVEDINMAEEETQQPEESPKESEEETSKEETSEEKVQKIDVKVDTTEIAEMKKQISELKELLLEKKKIKEKMEEVKEKVDETKGEVSPIKEEALQDVNNRIVEALGRGTYAMYRDYSKEDADTKLKRLIR